MASLNMCAFSGNVGKEPESRFSNNGVAYAKFTLAVTVYNRGNQTMWMECTTFDTKIISFLENWVHTGTFVMVTGALFINLWTKDGVTKATPQLTVSSLQLGPKAESKVAEPVKEEDPIDPNAEPVTADPYAAGF